MSTVQGSKARHALGEKVQTRNNASTKNFSSSIKGASSPRGQNQNTWNGQIMTLDRTLRSLGRGIISRSTPSPSSTLLNESPMSKRAAVASRRRKDSIMRQGKNSLKSGDEGIGSDATLLFSRDPNETRRTGRRNHSERATPLGMLLLSLLRSRCECSIFRTRLLVISSMPSILSVPISSFLIPSQWAAICGYADPLMNCRLQSLSYAAVLCVPIDIMGCCRPQSSFASIGASFGA